MKRFVLAASLVFAAGTAQAGATFDTVKARGLLVCGVHTGLPGFGAPDEKGVWAGVDVDICRAVAAAMFGDATKVKYVPLTSTNRFTSLQSGEVDLLSRNTTETLTRDTTGVMNFGPVNFYDGQGFLVAKKLNIKSALELKGATICTLTGTTTEQNLADYFRANKMDYKPVTFEKQDEASAAFAGGRCDAITSDKSQLGAIRGAQLQNPADYVILPETISKEPFATAVRHGDDQWFDLVKWSVYAMIEAEESGVTSKNVDEMVKSTDPNVQRLLGVSVGAGGGMGKALGVDDKFAYNIIKQVGNYGESFDRNLGPTSKINIERGLNNLWKNGGLQYAIPFR
ncbi:amino acid ABC transporter substrate-binding protein [Roseiterribacter gracilis]|uniref:ABC transporter substrate-binding protein n=1 Tax=Roseiterribacter gracilis TaxID=2812848 RepID=A0A8S8XBK8_9PROT|nr:ABC transporter substrate-binding protein [Rhodospirillales bacterium TMPK1]